MNTRDDEQKFSGWMFNGNPDILYASIDGPDWSVDIQIDTVTFIPRINYLPARLKELEHRI